MDKNLFFKKSKSFYPAFTLVELIVVIAIIALLVTLSLIALSNARMASRDSKRMADIKQLQTALELFYDSQDRYPTNAEFQSGSLSYFNGNLGTTTYISIPSAPFPADGRCSDAQNAYVYNAPIDGSTYTLNFCVAKAISDLPAGTLAGIPGGIVGACQPTCGTNNCGDNGCGGVCGICASPQTCGGSGSAGQCGCTAETDVQFYGRLNGVCGSLAGIDNCGQPRTVSMACASGYRCNNNACTQLNLTISGDGGQTRWWWGIASSEDGTKLAANAASMYVYTSSDSGITWVPRLTNPTPQWTSIASSQYGDKLAAVGSPSWVYFSSDYGVTWGVRGGNSRSWISIASSDDGMKIAAVASATTQSCGRHCTRTTYYPIEISPDAGVTWTQSSISFNWSSITSSEDGTKLAATVSGGYIYVSSDSGLTWATSTDAGSRYWASVTSSADGMKLAAADSDGYIYTSVDSGVTWTAQTGSGSRNWFPITSSDDGTKLAAAVNGGYIYTSDDSGVTWTAQTTLGSRIWRSVACSADGMKLAAVAYDDNIYLYHPN
jgi:type II secretory pathway pseudopilin PulG